MATINVQPPVLGQQPVNGQQPVKTGLSIKKKIFLGLFIIIILGIIVFVVLYATNIIMPYTTIYDSKILKNGTDGNATCLSIDSSNKPTTKLIANCSKSNLEDLWTVEQLRGETTKNRVKNMKTNTCLQKDGSLGSCDYNEWIYENKRFKTDGKCLDAGGGGVRNTYMNDNSCAGNVNNWHQWDIKTPFI